MKENWKYQINKDENKAFLKEIRDNLLVFGHQFPSPGGVSYYFGDDGTLWKESPRETWTTCRMAHVYSIGTFLDHEGSEALVDAAFHVLQQFFGSKDKAVGVVPENLDTVPFFITKNKCAAAFIGIQSELHMNHSTNSLICLRKSVTPQAR